MGQPLEFTVRATGKRARAGSTLGGGPCQGGRQEMEGAWLKAAEGRKDGGWQWWTEQGSEEELGEKQTQLRDEGGRSQASVRTQPSSFLSATEWAHGSHVLYQPSSAQACCLHPVSSGGQDMEYGVFQEEANNLEFDFIKIGCRKVVQDWL